MGFSIAVALLTACVWAQYFRLSSKNHIIPLSYRFFTFASAICSVFLTSEIIHNPKTCSLRGGRHFLRPSCQWICLSAPFKHKLFFNATNITHFHSSSTYFIVERYLVLRWSLLWWWRTKIGRQNFRLLITSYNSPSPFLTRLISQICNPLLRFSSRWIILTAKPSW